MNNQWSTKKPLAAKLAKVIKLEQDIDISTQLYPHTVQEKDKHLSYISI